jgi:hypothetical protein
LKELEVKTYERKRLRFVVWILFIIIIYIATKNLFALVDEKNISFQVFIVPKYNENVNFTIEIPGLDTSYTNARRIQTPHYTITKRYDAGMKQALIISFELSCNNSESLLIRLDDLKPIEGIDPKFSTYNLLVRDVSLNKKIRKHFSTFISIYKVKAPLLWSPSEIPIYQDIYHYKSPRTITHYTTSEIPFLIKISRLILSFLISGFVFIRVKKIFVFYPWLTLLIMGISILSFIFLTPAELFIFFKRNFLSGLFQFTSYFSHHNFEHLIGNMTLGAITLFLLESPISYQLNKGFEIRMRVLFLIFISKNIFWAIKIGGFGASFVNEVLGVFLIFNIIIFRKILVITKYRLLLYPLICFLAGYSLFSYVIDWLIRGYILKIDVKNALFHFYAFIWGILISMTMFFMNTRTREKILNFIDDVIY